MVDTNKTLPLCKQSRTIYLLIKDKRNRQSILTSSDVWSYKEDFFKALTLRIKGFSSQLRFASSSEVGILEYFILRCQGGGEEFINQPVSRTLSKR